MLGLPRSRVPLRGSPFERWAPQALGCTLAEAAAGKGAAALAAAVHLTRLELCGTDDPEEPGYSAPEVARFLAVLRQLPALQAVAYCEGSDPTPLSSIIRGSQECSAALEQLRAVRPAAADELTRQRARPASPDAECVFDNFPWYYLY